MKEISLEELGIYKYAVEKFSIVSITDEKGYILYANDKFCELSKYSQEELIGSPQSIVKSGYHPNSFFAEMWKTIAMGEVWRGEVKNRNKEGGFYWVDTTIIPLKDSKNRIYSYFSIRIDITERKKAQEGLKDAIIELTKAQEEVISLNKSLEERVKIKTFKLSEALEEVKAKNEELMQFNDLLNQSIQQLEEKKKEIEKQHTDITSSIRYAKRIQTAFLPSESDFKKLFPHSFIFFKPKSIVSGDLYWFTKKIGKIFVAAIDCTGHGVPGAFMSMLAHTIFEKIVNENHIIEVDKILMFAHQEVNQMLRQDITSVRDGMDVSLCMIDVKNRFLEFSGAKMPLVYIEQGNLTWLKGDKSSIGGWEYREVSFTKKKIPIPFSTQVYLFSDGIEDQFGGYDRRKFGRNRVKDMLQRVNQHSFEEQKQNIEIILDLWKGSENQTDDIMLLGFGL
jgi:PAS domain S-box-containing protein